MAHKTDKDLETIISTVKGVRIILTRERLASILGIREEEDTLTMDSIKSPLTSTPIGVFTRVVNVLRLSTRSAQIINFIMFNNCNYSWDEKNKVWIPMAEEDRLREHELSYFSSIKKTTQTNNVASSLQPDGKESEDDDSYDLFGGDEPSTSPWQPSRTRCRLSSSNSIVESTHPYADELAHQRASIYRQESGSHIEDNVLLINPKNDSLRPSLYRMSCCFAYPIMKLTPSSLICAFMPKRFTPFYSLFF
ncbi:hypothetical protein M9H77_07767 [Catharanthus roseus]|uniref:Uncharacterized protein n=1 Tax=Catharanthus roseus TaxID=4058 RepID=A0ACC0BW39_CATRO|nr:hypothetical protein M9H77_07767 [Catharanthus roseus]